MPFHTLTFKSFLESTITSLLVTCNTLLSCKQTGRILSYLTVRLPACLFSALLTCFTSSTHNPCVAPNRIIFHNILSMSFVFQSSCESSYPIICKNPSIGTSLYTFGMKCCSFSLGRSSQTAVRLTFLSFQ